MAIILRKASTSIPKNVKDAQVIFMIHGGAWRFGDKSNASVVVNKAKFWLPKNTIFISTNYRMLPEAKPDIQADDVAKALAFAQSNAGNWGGNAEKFILMGHSAGAHLAALVVSSQQYQASLKPILGTVLLDSAALNAPKLLKERPLPLYQDAFGNGPDYLIKTSP